MVEHNFKWKNDGRTKVMIGCGTQSGDYSVLLADDQKDVENILIVVLYITIRIGIEI